MLLERGAHMSNAGPHERQSVWRILYTGRNYSNVRGDDTKAEKLYFTQPLKATFCRSEVGQVGHPAHSSHSCICYSGRAESTKWMAPLAYTWLE